MHLSRGASPHALTPPFLGSSLGLRGPCCLNVHVSLRGLRSAARVMLPNALAEEPVPRGRARPLGSNACVAPVCSSPMFGTCLTHCEPAQVVQASPSGRPRIQRRSLERLWNDAELSVRHAVDERLLEVQGRRLEQLFEDLDRHLERKQEAARQSRGIIMGVPVLHGAARGPARRSPSARAQPAPTCRATAPVRSRPRPRTPDESWNIPLRPGPCCRSRSRR